MLQFYAKKAWWLEISTRIVLCTNDFFSASLDLSRRKHDQSSAQAAHGNDCFVMETPAMVELHYARYVECETCSGSLCATTHAPADQGGENQLH